MNIYDLKPTETFWEEVDDRNLYKDDAQLWSKKELIDDIRKNGIKYALNVDSEGNIKNGNMRYWVARYLYEEEGLEHFKYIPVQRNWVAGCFWKEISFTVDNHYSEDQMHTVMNDLAQQITEYWINQTRDLTIPSRTSWPDIKTCPINKKRTEHYWNVQRNIWNRYYFPQPTDADKMAFLATISPSFPIEIMKESPKVIKEFKQWTVDHAGRSDEFLKFHRANKKKMKAVI
jgi:hypothetical protein